MCSPRLAAWNALLKPIAPRSPSPWYETTTASRMVRLMPVATACARPWAAPTLPQSQ
jgi:hypothetical protein